MGSDGTRHKSTAIVAVLVVLAGAFLVPAVYGAVATITVDRTDDTAAASACTAALNDCSLRGAVLFANAHPGTSLVEGTVITVPVGTYQLTIAGSTGSETNGLCGNANVGDLDVSGNNTVINGAGAASTIIQQTTSDRVICLNPSVVDDFVFHMAGVLVTGGREPTGVGGAGIVGGGFHNKTFLSNCAFSNNQMTASASIGGGALGMQGGDVSITNCSIGGANPPGASQTDTTLSNLSGTSGGGLSFMAGDITLGHNTGVRTTTDTLTLTNSTFTNNVANSGSAGGGAIDTFAFDNPGGNAIANVSNSTFTSNKANNQAGGAIVVESGELHVSQSTFTNNTAGFNGGAIYHTGGGAGTTITKSLFTGNQVTNSTGHGGAIGESASASDLTVTFSRFVGNTAATAANGNTVSKASGGAGSNFFASNNWWSRSSGPNATDVSGTVTTAPFLQLKTTANPSTIVTNQTTALTASFNTNSANADVSTNIDVLLGLSVTWSAVGGNLSGQQASIQTSGGGKGTATATYTGTAAAASNSATAQVDNGPASGSTNTAAITVNKADTTASIGNGSSLSTNHSVTGQPVAVTYSVVGAFGNTPTAPTGTVTVSDGTDSCTATLAAGTCNVTFRTAGAKTLTATYNGDSNFKVSPASASASHTVDKADTTTTITSDTPDPSVTGQSVSFSVSVAAVAPGAAVAPTTITGTVTVSDGGTNSCIVTLVAGTGSCSIAFPAAGPYSLNGTYSGDANFNGSSTASSTAHTVNKADTNTAITSDVPDPSSHGTSVTVNYTVVAKAPGAGTPTGNVTVSDGVDSCTATVAAGMCNVSLTTPGARTLVATYVGDSNYNGSASTNTAHTVTAPDLTVSKSHSGNFIQGEDGDQYTITVTNSGTEATSGTVTVVDSAPAGLAPTAILGTGWSCTLATLTCTRSDALGTSASYLPITLTVNVDNNATNLTNSATVSGGNEVNTSNDTATDPTTVVADTFPPNTTIDTNPTNPTNSSTATFTFSGTDVGTGVASFECDLDGSGFTACTSPAVYNSLGDASHTFQVRAIDAKSNVDLSPASYIWTVDTTNPSVAIDQASSQSDPTAAATVHFTAVFSEPVSDFATGDVTLAGTAGATTGTVTEVGPNDGTTYDVAVSGMTADGSVIASVSAGVAHDAATNPNDASTSTDDTVAWVLDTTNPTVALDQASGQPDPTTASQVHFTVVFSEPVSDFATGDVTLSGTAGATTGTVSEVAPNDGTTYDVAVTGMTITGTVIASLASGVAHDSANNPNDPSTSTDDTVSFEIDTTNPTVALSQASGQSDPTSASPIHFTAVFSEPVSDFATGDVTLSGTAGATTGTVSEVAPNDATTYDVAISGMAISGTIVASIAAGVAHDAANNPNDASTSTDDTVTFVVDTTNPSVAIDQASGQADPTPTSPVHFTVLFSEGVADFATGDVTLSGTAGATTATVSEVSPNDGTTYDVAVSGMTSNGTVIASIAAGVAHDGANNANDSSTSTDNTVTFLFDTTPPETTIDSHPTNPTTSTSATLTFSGTDNQTPAGALAFECSFDAAPFSACTSAQTFSSLSLGFHTFAVRATDAANNTDSTPATFTWQVVGSTGLLYNGAQIVVIGSTFQPAALLSSSAASCASGKTISFSLDRNPATGAAGPYALPTAVTNGSGQATMSALSTTGWLEGVYDITASFAGGANCLPASDSATLTVAGPGDSAAGGGWYTLSGSGRINFGFTVRKVDGRCTASCAYTGQILLNNNGKWRLKGSLTSYSKTSNGHGAASGAGNLYWWNSSLNGGLGNWQLAQAGATFTASFYDDGKSGKKSADKFGIHINYTPVPPQPSSLPNSSPQQLKGGNIKVA